MDRVFIKNKTRSKLIFFSLIIEILASVFFISKLNATEYSFQELWEKAQDSDVRLKKEEHQLHYVKILFDRSQYHWLPQAYLNAQHIMTDSPSMNFMSQLGQRSITNNDFDSQKLNYPGQNQWSQGVLGVKWALYEGGGRESVNSSLKSLWSSQDLFVQAVNREVYSHLFFEYFSALQNDELAADLDIMLKLVHQQMSSYKLGRKNNPIGYSGLLGLKSVKNQILAYKDQALNQLKSHKIQIQKITNITGEWNFKKNSSFKDLEKKISWSSESEIFESSLQIKAREYQQESLELQAKTKASRHRPQVGVFAETQIYNGERDNNSEQRWGLYLQWNWSHESLGLSQEVSALKLIEKMKTRVLKNKEEADKKSDLETLKTLQKNKKRLEESNKMLEEQLLLSKTLYRNGAINAIQLSDVYSRRLEARYQLYLLENKYLKLKTKLFTHLSKSIKE